MALNGLCSPCVPLVTGEHLRSEVPTFGELLCGALGLLSNPKPGFGHFVLSSLGPQSGPWAELAEDLSGGSTSPTIGPSGQAAASSQPCRCRETGRPNMPSLMGWSYRRPFCGPRVTGSSHSYPQVHI